MSQVVISPPKPHSQKQALIMQGLVTPGVREIWVSCGTKFGKSLSAAAAACALLCSGRRDLKIRWLAPIYRQAEIGYDYCRKMLPPEPLTKTHQGNLTVSIPDLESRIRFLHSSRPIDLEGAAIHGYLFDEAAKMANLDEVYSSAWSTRTVTKGPMMFFSTPFGKNAFYRKCMQAREEMIAAHKAGRVPEKIFISARTTDNPFIDAAEVEKARLSLPDRLFRQLYLAEFVDQADVFTGFRDCYWTERIEQPDLRQDWRVSDAKECEVVIGADWAKTNDRTTFMAVDLQTKKVIGLRRFYKTPYTEAIRDLVRFADQFGNVKDVWHDATGLGSVIDDHLAHTGLPYLGISFSNARKAEMVTSLITNIERKDIWLPHFPPLELEMEAYEAKANKIGTMSYGHPPGGHDDCVDALMLANSAMDHYAARDLRVRYLEDLAADEKMAKVEAGSLEAYYRDIYDDED